jgi:hypothetical protein
VAFSRHTIARTECARVNHFAIANKRRNCHYSALSHSHTAPLAARITYTARAALWCLFAPRGREGGGRNVKEDSASARSPTVVWVESKRRTLSLVMGASYAAQSYLYEIEAPRKKPCARVKDKSNKSKQRQTNISAKLQKIVTPHSFFTISKFATYKFINTNNLYASHEQY